MFVMPVPDQARDDGTGIQNMLELLDFPMPFAGNDLSKGFQSFYEFIMVENK